MLPERSVGEIWLRERERRQRLPQPSHREAEQFGAHTADGDGPYLRTGDLGLLHDGELYVTGRRKDLLIVNGRNLYPQDIEEFVQEVHPAVAGSRGSARSQSTSTTPNAWS